MLEEIKRIADDYEMADDKVLSYYHKLLTALENHQDIVVEEDDVRIANCLERIVSERASISETKSDSMKPFTVAQTIERAIATEFGLGLQTDEFATFDNISHHIAYKYDKTVDEFVSETAKKMELQERTGNLRLL